MSSPVSVPLPRLPHAQPATPIWPILPAQSEQAVNPVHPQARSSEPVDAHRHFGNAGTTAASRAARVETVYLDASPIDEKCGLLSPASRASGPSGGETTSQRFAWFGSRARHAESKQQQQCCKELKGEDERHLVSPAIVRDV
jgi:hypothetical protein